MHILLVSSFFALFISFFTACGDSQDGASGSEESAVPSSLPPETTLSFNPVLKFETELTKGVSAKANFSNDDPTHFWEGNERVTVSLTNNGNTVILSFKLTNGDDVELILSNFIDLGNDGYVDEYSVEAKVNGQTKVSQTGQFLGNTKPRNSNVSKPIDINRAPTEEEFRKYIVGKPLYHIETWPDPGDDEGFEIFNADGTVDSFEIVDHDSEDYDDHDEVDYWKYDYNNGDPILILDEKSKTSSHYHHDRIRLIFDNFYEGKFEKIHEEEDGVIIDPEKYPEEFSRGTWKIFSKIPNL